ncbi:aminotransferase class IV [Flavobacterium terrae]|uniref:branched-chain-amino-acid transaminase n=1 Tax=Flavobacterium terrae TaxID=415425 RepID=A0A1M6DE02_9FLAO|nr:aminotransferase class IV [Flavobacterium terrae]SHI71385.1 branched-chain amino acid aminotransferase [Flavobacterium terrae]
MTNSLLNNRGFLYGDALFETVKILDGKILFLEDHYFRLMSSMRILRMEIPMNFTMEFFESEILNEVKKEQLETSARARMTVYRKDGGFYLPDNNAIDYVISVSKIEKPIYEIENTTYEVDIFKDFYVSKQLISTLKSTNKIVQITGSIYAKENALDNCILLNEDKNVVEVLNGNIFMLKDKTLTTPPVSEGCLNGIMRKQIIALAKTIDDLTFTESNISPFDLQKADEIFITNVIKGIQPITKYRKKEFETSLAKSLISKLNVKIRLS